MMEKLKQKFKIFRSNKTEDGEVQMTGKAQHEAKSVRYRWRWKSSVEYIMYCFGMTMGIANVWRFPYIAYEYGGGAFLLIYFVLLVAVGQPMFYAECLMGQFSSIGPITIYKMVPAARGICVASSIQCILISAYYNVFLVYSLLYLFSSFSSTLPWSDCSIWWGSNVNCTVRGKSIEENLPMCHELQKQTGESNLREGLKCKGWDSSTHQYWIYYILQEDDKTSLSHIGYLLWDKVLGLIFIWIVVGVCLVLGIRSLGKFGYVTAIVPFILIFIMLIMGLSLSGGLSGLSYLFVPSLDRMIDVTVWWKAATQMLFSLCLSYGSIIIFGSHNNFTYNLYKDVILLTFCDTLTSVICSMVVFSNLGYLADQSGVSFYNVTTIDPGLGFMVVPEAVTMLPVPQLWCFLFFTMIFVIGLDSEFNCVDTSLVQLSEMYRQIKLFRKREFLVFIAYCCFGILLSLPCAAQGGLYVVDFLETYVIGYGLLINSICELVAIMWLYGMNRFSNDVEFMLGSMPNFYWRICWKYISPGFLIVIFIAQFYHPLKRNHKEEYYEAWAQCLGAVITLVQVIQIPIWGLWSIFNYKKKEENWKLAFKPPAEWGPLDHSIRSLYLQWRQAPKTADSRFQSSMETAPRPRKGFSRRKPPPLTRITSPSGSNILPASRKSIMPKDSMENSLSVIEEFPRDGLE